MDSHSHDKQIGSAIDFIYRNCKDATSFDVLPTEQQNYLLTGEKPITQPSTGRKGALPSRGNKSQDNTPSAPQIVQIDKSLKLDPRLTISLNKDVYYFYNLSEYHPQIEAIRVSSLLGLSTRLITFELKNGEKLHTLAKNIFDAEFNFLAKNLPTEHVEIRFKKQFKATREAYAPSFWSVKEGSESKNWDDAKTHSYYADISDPLIMDKFEEQLKQIKKENKTDNIKKLIIVDAGAGKGRLAEKLITKLKEYEIPFTYILVEPDKSECDVARKIVAKFPEYDPENKGDIKVINATIHDFALTQEKGTVNQIVSSGGPLNVDIVTLPVAEQNLTDIVNLLAPEGVIIATGLTKLFFNQKHFKEKGLEVSSTTERSTQDDQLYQCYVLQKPAEVPSMSPSKNL